MKKNAKVIIGIILGIIIGTSTLVGATTIFRSEDITYSSSATTKTNVKDSLDELYSKVGKCPDGWYCYNFPIGIKDQVELGDYIKITPPLTSYTIKKELTGYSEDQTINPSELDLWLVTEKYQSGDIRVLSVYGTTEQIIFQGEIGYRNFTMVLNEASRWVGSGLPYIVGSAWSVEGYGVTEVCNDIYNCHVDKIKSWDIDNAKRLTGTGAVKNKAGIWIPYWAAFRVKDIGKDYYLLPYYRPGYEEYGYATLMGSGVSSDASAGSSLRPILAIRGQAMVTSGSGTFDDPYMLGY